MRAFKIVVVGALSALIVIVLATFAIENLQHVPARLFGNSFTPNLSWIAIAGGLLGFALAVLLLEPRRTAIRENNRSLSREHSWMESEMEAMRSDCRNAEMERDELRTRLRAAKVDMETLRVQYGRMQAECEDMRSDRDQLRARLTAAKEVASGEVPPAAIAGNDDSNAPEQQDSPADGRIERELEALRLQHNTLRAQYSYLRADHEDIRTERDQLRVQLATVNEVVSEDSTPPDVAPEAIASAAARSESVAGAMDHPPVEEQLRAD